MIAKVPGAVDVFEDKDKDFYVPYFVFKVSGEDVSRAIYDVLQISYRDNIDEIGSFDVTINNWDDEKYDLKYSEQDLFDPGKKVEIFMGYRGKGPFRRMLQGKIKSFKLTFPAGGKPTVSIGGLSVLDQLRRKQVSRKFLKKTDSEIAKEIIGPTGLKIVTKADNQEERHEYLAQENQYDLVFLKERAKALDYVLVVNEPPGANPGPPEIYFGPPEKSREVTYRLVYGKSLIQFSVALNTANQVKEVTVRRPGRNDKTLIEATATRDQARVPGLNNSSRQSQLESSFSKRTEVLTSEKVENKGEARLHATRRMKEIGREFIKGGGSTLGLPDLRAGSFVEIAGVGESFSGRYFVTSTTHSIGDGGYTTQFQCRRE